MRTRHGTRLAIGLATVALAIGTAASSAAACMVGTGTGASCTDAALNACLSPAPGYDGTVTFNCGGPKTIDISTGTGTKTISANTTIDGGGVITISGGNSVGVFHVNPDIAFTVRNLTIANGNGAAGSGAGIFNDGTLTVINSTFTNNAANGGGGGIHNNGGTLTVIDSTFASNGGGAAGGGGIREGDSGPVHVLNCTFDGNSGNGGGGIRNDGGTVDVTNSTFTHNSGGSGGGGIYSDGTLTVTNSTLTGNNAGGGGGGIRNANGTATLTNTIIANSTAGGDCVNNATVIDGGHNLIEDTGATACGLSDGVKGNVIGQDPNLDPTGLQNNGGPTQTVAVLGDSSAINAGDEGVCASPPVSSLDQRGYFRPGVGFPNCTIGAYEYGARPPGVSAPALSPVGLLGLGALLIGAGVVSVRRRAIPESGTGYFLVIGGYSSR